MIFFTLQDAAVEVKPIINGGSCSDPLAYTRLNQATRRLLNRNRKPVHIRRLIRFFTRKDIITLPHEVERILYYDMDGAPGPLFSSAYEFVSHGPGELGCSPACAAGNYLEDLGNHYSLMFDVPGMEMEANSKEPLYRGHSLVAFSADAGDIGSALTLFGRNIRNEDLGQTGVPLVINQWAGGVEGNLISAAGGAELNLLGDVRDITRIIKPRTNGFVSLYTYDPQTFQMYFLAKYHPYETHPRYRRYRLTAPNYRCGSAILAWCELGYVPHEHATDVLLIQNIDALKLMVMAIELENERDFQMAKAYEADAYRLIEEQRMSERTHDYNLIQVSGCYGFGDVRRA